MIPLLILGIRLLTLLILDPSQSTVLRLLQRNLHSLNRFPQDLPTIDP